MKLSQEQAYVTIYLLRKALMKQVNILTSCPISVLKISENAIKSRVSKTKFQM